MPVWRKLGCIFTPDGNYDWMETHASVPFVVSATSGIITVFFSSRNKSQESAIASIKFNINTLKVVEVFNKPILLKGELGSFDDSGVMGCCVLETNQDIRLYYIGWNLGITVPFRNAIGVASSSDGGQTFKRLYNGPILDRTKDEPHFVASNCVLFDEGIYKIWYLSCTDWFVDSTGKVTHRYHIKYSESNDGINWDRRGKVAIDYQDDYEYAISVPRVIKDHDKYRMWFSSRATKDVQSYRIRYAESVDGISWTRKDNEVGIDVSESGWDSEMICYPYVFDYEGGRYMLYNGNNYGKTGFGLAIMESK